MSKEIDELKKRLDEHEVRINNLENSLKSEKTLGKNNDCLRKLSNDANIKEDQLYHIFYRDGDEISLVCSFKGSNSVKQFKATLSLLTVYNYCHGVDRIKASDLNQKLKETNIGSLSALSPNLSKDTYRKFIRKEGKPGSHAFVYKITPLGIKEGLKIIKELITQERT